MFGATARLMNAPGVARLRRLPLFLTGDVEATMTDKSDSAEQRRKSNAVAFHATALAMIAKMEAIAALESQPRVGPEWDALVQTLPPELLASERWLAARAELSKALYALKVWRTGNGFMGSAGAEDEEVKAEYEDALRSPEHTTKKLRDAVRSAVRSVRTEHAAALAVAQSREAAEQHLATTRVRQLRDELAALHSDYAEGFAFFRPALARLGGYPRMGRFDHLSSACHALLRLADAMAKNEPIVWAGTTDRIESEQLRCDVEAEIAERLRPADEAEVERLAAEVGAHLEGLRREDVHQALAQRRTDQRRLAATAFGKDALALLARQPGAIRAVEAFNGCGGQRWDRLRPAAERGSAYDFVLHELAEMVKCGLMDKPRKGQYRITDDGLREHATNGHPAAANP